MGVLGIICLFVALVMFLRGQSALKDNKLKLIERNGEPRIAVLIPARDESAVINDLLLSISRQTVRVRPEDVYVIVEDLGDPTVDICKQRGNRVILREDLSKQRKGFALDEAVKQIFERGEHYDLYFVFDADNVLDENYFAEMLKSYMAGYEIATGYRYPKNGNQNVITAVSALTFSMINVMGNCERVKQQANIVFSGTGFYVVGELVDEWQGWPFHSLTEDYEMSLYATLHGITTTYNEQAKFYDEQPVHYRQTVLQRVRWIKGYFMARRKYIPLIKARKHADNYGSLVREKIGVKPVIWAIIGLVLLILDGVAWMIYLGKYVKILKVLAVWVIVIYLILAIITMVLIKRERTEFSPQIKVKAVLFNPIYLVTYVPCALKALLTKNVSWKKIDHGKK